MVKATLLDLVLNKKYTIKEKSLTIGRGESNDIVTARVAGGVSRDHAVLAYNSKLESYILFDNYSKFGTYVNGVRVDKTPLKDGDILKLGTDEGGGEGYSFKIMYEKCEKENQEQEK